MVFIEFPPVCVVFVAVFPPVCVVFVVVFPPVCVVFVVVFPPLCVVFVDDGVLFDEKILELNVDGNGTPDVEIVGGVEPLFFSFFDVFSSEFELKSVFTNIPDSALTCPIILPTTL